MNQKTASAFFVCLNLVEKPALHECASFAFENVCCEFICAMQKNELRHDEQIVNYK